MNGEDELVHKTEILPTRESKKTLMLFQKQMLGILNISVTQFYDLFKKFLFDVTNNILRDKQTDPHNVITKKHLFNFGVSEILRIILQKISFDFTDGSEVKQCRGECCTLGTLFTLMPITFVVFKIVLFCSARMKKLCIAINTHMSKYYNAQFKKINDFLFKRVKC